MKIKRFHIPVENIADGEARLPEAEAWHLKNVLRIREGGAVEIFDGAGKAWSGRVAFRRDAVFVAELAELPAPERGGAPSPRHPRLVLALALIKPARLEWALEKAVELGVDEFLPLQAARSEIRIPKEKLAGRLERWERIATESAKQCRRLDLMRVRPPMAFREFCAAGEYARFDKIMFYEKSREPWRPELPEVGVGMALCVGPEGGWTEDEVTLAEGSGCEVYGLGPRILRAETAAIAATAALRLTAAAR
ncbi:MAG: 16S rRNA (uracil(1498)-N(3))-methyltransferase [Acidobacteriota bacterium]|jgi:16S rRNA (uracil1498-N3)-methyltransferase|nr:16S rRNA (uracil(1498)-N(3))-methyltransferase [Acidobacteriota bacterium]